LGRPLKPVINSTSQYNVAVVYPVDRANIMLLKWVRQQQRKVANSAFHPYGVGKWVVIHVFTWITRVATIKRQTRAGHGC